MSNKSRQLVSRAPMVRRAAGYDELWRQIDFRTLDIPEQFNLGVACLDDQDPTARALTIVSRDRSSRDYTFGQLADQANRLANALGELGIGRGDVVGIVNAASVETGVAFLAVVPDGCDRAAALVVVRTGRAGVPAAPRRGEGGDHCGSQCVAGPLGTKEAARIDHVVVAGGVANQKRARTLPIMKLLTLRDRVEAPCPLSHPG